MTTRTALRTNREYYHYPAVVGFWSFENSASYYLTSSSCLGKSSLKSWEGVGLLPRRSQVTFWVRSMAWLRRAPSHLGFLEEFGGVEVVGREKDGMTNGPAVTPLPALVHLRAL